MARNKLAGKGKVYKQRSEASRKRKLEYDKKFQKRPEQVKKRVEANRANRKYGKKGDGLDYDHAVKKMVPTKVNRGRKGEGNRVKKNK